MAERGYRLVLFTGDPSPFTDPAIVRGIMEERFPQALIDRIRTYDRHQRIFARAGHTERTLGPAHGFSQTYVFGPHQFAAWMTAEDAALLFRNEWDRWQFLDITDTPSVTARPPLTRRQWQALFDSFAKLDERRKLRPQFR